MIHCIGLYEQIYNIFIRRTNENSLNDFKYNPSFEVWKNTFPETVYIYIYIYDL